MSLNNSLPVFDELYKFDNCLQIIWKVKNNNTNLVFQEQNNLLI